jgi:hypothetical protein
MPFVNNPYAIVGTVKKDSHLSSVIHGFSDLYSEPGMTKDRDAGVKIVLTSFLYSNSSQLVVAFRNCMRKFENV